MNDYELGYKAYMEEFGYDANQSEKWKQGYIKAVEDDLNEIFGKETLDTTF